MTQGQGVEPSTAGESTALPAPRAGWAAAWLLCPHVLLGAWLMVVPDYRAFLASQIVVLTHVGLALLTLPPLAWWIFRHARRMKGPAPRQTRSAFSARWLLTGTVACAGVTGVLVLWGGDIIAPDKLHEACGVAVGLALAFHLWLGARRWAAGGIALLVALSIGGASTARRLLPPRSPDPVTPAFAYKDRPADLYESATWCGQCHVQDFDDWSRSLHARTLFSPALRAGALKFQHPREFDLAQLGGLLKGERPPGAELAIGNNCVSCHGPVTFYGDDPTPVFRATGVTSEGVTCDVCHTIRALWTGGPRKDATGARTIGTIDEAKLLPKLPYYVSAPETVRRYLGQGSRNPFARAIADYLIRWRPEVHRRDYHSPLMDDSRACMACHSMGGLDSDPEVPHKTYFTWEHSGFNTGNPKTTVTCEDCHMVQHMTGKPVVEAQRMVPWGPERRPGRSHLMLGGDVTTAQKLTDQQYALLEHELNTRAATVSISHVVREPGAVSVTVAVHSLLVGHAMPSLETHIRYLWVEVRALDASGKVLAATKPPKNSEDFESESPLIFRCTEQPKADCDTVIPPLSTREYTARLALPPDAKPARLEARLFTSVDPQPMATTSSPFTVLALR